MWLARCKVAGRATVAARWILLTVAVVIITMACLTWDSVLSWGSSDESRGIVFWGGALGLARDSSGSDSCVPPGIEWGWNEGTPVFAEVRWPNVVPLSASSSIIVIPLWLPLVILGVGTVAAWACGRSRVNQTCCAICAYDLTGNLSGRCPECGAVIPKEQDAQNVN